MFALSIVAAPLTFAQTQYVTATPGYINLGMTTTIVVSAPGAGTYTAVVEKPSGTEANFNFTFTSAGQTLNATYGNSTGGFGAVVDQTGTYNVFLEQGGNVVSSTAFYATDKLVITMDMVTGGTCALIQGVDRGGKLIPRFYVQFASSGAYMTNDTAGASIEFTLPSGGVAAASWDPFARLFDAVVDPNWNYTDVGTWSPKVNASDAAGNFGTFQYTGSPYVISPAQLTTATQVVDTATGQVVTTLSDGVGVTIQANITYPSNAETVPGFVGPLDSTRGGVVTAEVGWGFYNATSGTFGGSTPGGLIETVSMTYTGSNGTWTGQFESNDLPALSPGTTYLVVVASHDNASPANTGFGTEVLSSVPSSAAVQTTSTQTVTESVQSIPSEVYAGLVILLILGVIIGYIVKVPR
jgi:hypothetical protein